MKLCERIIQAIPSTIRERVQPKAPPDKLVVELAQVREDLLRARIEFDTLTNLDLIESCIYQMESLEVRYNYLLKQARMVGLSQNEYLEGMILNAAS